MAGSETEESNAKDGPPSTSAAIKAPAAAQSGEGKGRHTQPKPNDDPQIDEFGQHVKPNQQTSGRHSEENSRSSPRNESAADGGSETNGAAGPAAKTASPKDAGHDQSDSLHTVNGHNGPSAGSDAEARANVPSHKATISEVSQLSTTHEVLQGDTGAVSEWSHQALAPRAGDLDEKKAADEWQSMPSYAAYDIYDDDGKLVAKEAPDSDEEANAYHGLGGAGKGYTRVQDDEDAQSATSMDDNTGYLFNKQGGQGTDLTTEDEEQRDPLAQLQATKSLLTEGQRIAYVGLARLAMAEMVDELEKMNTTRATKKLIAMSAESTKMWSQKMMVRLYKHMDIESAGQTPFPSPEQNTGGYS